MTTAGVIREKLRTAIDRIGERYFVDPAAEPVGPETIERVATRVSGKVPRHAGRQP